MEITKENINEMKGFECVVVDDIYGLGSNRKGFISAIKIDEGFTISDDETEKDLFCVNHKIKNPDMSIEEDREIVLFILNLIFKTGKISIEDYNDHPI